MSKESITKREKWAMWNKILNALRKYSGLEEVDPKNNPYGFKEDENTN